MKNFSKKFNRINFLLTLFLVALMSGCSGDDTASTPAASTTNVATDAVTNLTAVSDDMMPASLSDGTLSAQNYQEHGMVKGFTLKDGAQGPCTGYSFASCQPVLLQLYMAMAKMQLDMIITMVSQVGTAIGDIPDGTSSNASEGGMSISFSKTSNTNFQILGGDGTNSGMYLSVNGSSYTLQSDFSALDIGEADAPTGGKLETVISYTDSDNWSLNTKMIDMPCDPTDVAAPQNIVIKITKANGVWTGKAMMYHPRWIGSNTCATTPADNISINIYTDFVADDLVAKANVYMGQSSVDWSAAVKTDYEVTDLCSNYGGALGGSCVNDFMGGNAASVTVPFCNPASTNEAIWNTGAAYTTCLTTSSTVQNASFGSSSDWINMNALKSETVTLPTSL